MSNVTSRRSFLGGALALSAIVVVPSIGFGKELPCIYGDGIHDDTAGLQALFDGEPFQVEGEGFLARQGEIRGGRFAIGRPIHLKGRWIVKDTTFVIKREFQGDAALVMD